MTHVCFDENGLFLGNFSNIEEAKFYCFQVKGSFCVSMTEPEFISFILRAVRERGNE